MAAFALPPSLSLPVFLSLSLTHKHPLSLACSCTVEHSLDVVAGALSRPRQMKPNPGVSVLEMRSLLNVKSWRSRVTGHCTPSLGMSSIKFQQNLSDFVSHFWGKDLIYIKILFCLISHCNIHYVFPEHWERFFWRIWYSQVPWLRMIFWWSAHFILNVTA